MPKPFDELREQLLRAGVAPRHVRRYLTELTDHLADLRREEMHSARNAGDAEVEAFARLGNMDDLAKAMIEQRQFQSWCARAPWAMFSLAPTLALAAAWAVALFILWSGWNIFLPGADTPFGGHREGGFANLYFQFGKAIYFFAPILVGWGIGAFAAHQRLRAIWPAFGLMLIALIGGASQVHASRTVTHGFGHINMSFNLAPTAQGGYPDGLLHAAILLAITALPYLIWKLQEVWRLA
ncbi:MAG: hypothetical protein WA430_14875 [Acidobacteriaceae bacterium]